MPRTRKAAPVKPVVTLETVPLTAPDLPKAELDKAVTAAGATTFEAVRFVKLCSLVTVRTVLEAIPDQEAAAILAAALFVPVRDRYDQVRRLEQKAVDYLVTCIDLNRDINVTVVKLRNLLRFMLLDRELVARTANARVAPPRRPPDEGVATREGAKVA